EEEFDNEVAQDALADAEEGNSFRAGNLAVTADGSIRQNFAFGANTMGGMGGAGGFSKDANRHKFKNGKDKQSGSGKGGAGGGMPQSGTMLGLEIRQTQELNSDASGFGWGAAPGRKLYENVSGAAIFASSLGTFALRNDPATMQRGLEVLSR